MKRKIQVALASCALLTFIFEPAVGLAASPQDSTGASASNPLVLANGSLDPASRKVYESMKAALTRSPDFSRSETISGNTRTIHLECLTGQVSC